MALVYSCRGCGAPLIVDERIQQILRTVPGQAEFRCRICGDRFTASDLLERSTTQDVQDVAVLPDPNAGLPDFPSVLARLRSEHRPGFVYRGQVRFHPGPLVPIIYREQLTADPLQSFDPDRRLRGVGLRFHRLAMQPPSDEMGRRMQVGNYLNHLFGYPIAQVLAQQFGIQSEGLDITASLDVAAVFAKFDFRRRAFLSAAGNPGVIYRFPVSGSPIDAESLPRCDFYNCPSTLLATDTLRLLRPCESLEEAIQSWFDYKVRLALAKADDSSARRPLEVLRLPAQAIDVSRVGMQQAGLLLPDMMLSQFYRQLNKQPPAGKAEDEGMSAVEDMSSRDRAAAFRFVHSAEDESHLRIDPGTLFPREDPLLTMLAAFLREDAIGKLIFHTEMWPVSDQDGHGLLE